MVVKEGSKQSYTNLALLSLSKSHVPSCLKCSIIIPVLKKSNLNTNEYKNFRPVSNISFVSKLIEKCVYLQIQSYLEYNHLFCQFQSAYHIGHSCETALTRIHDDLLSGDCYDCTEHQSNLHNSLLMLSDLSAALIL